MDLDITFGNHTMKTAVYIKMVAHDQLLLSEGACQQLRILHYHPSVELWRGSKKRPAQQQTDNASLTSEPQNDTSVIPGNSQDQEAAVPMVHVNLLQSTHVLPHQSKVVEVVMPDLRGQGGCYLVEPSSLDSRLRTGPIALQVSSDEPVFAVISNPSGVSVTLEVEDQLGEATPVDVVESPERADEPKSIQETLRVRKVQSKPVSWRTEQLVEIIGIPEALTPQQREFLNFVTEHHNVFALEEYERGETSLVEMKLDTGDAHPR